MENLNLNLTDFNGTNENETDLKLFAKENSTLSNWSTNGNDSLITKIALNFTILPILLLTGIFGNISTAIVFFRIKDKNTSIVYIIALAISDLLVLICRLVSNIYTIGHMYFTEAIRYVRPNSFIWIHFSHMPQRSGNLFILAIVIERFTAVWFPMKYRQVWTTKRACVLAAIIVFLSLGDLVTVLDALLFSLNESIPEEGVVSTQDEAGRYISYQGKIVGTWSSTYRILFDIAPLPLVFVFNVTIIAGIKRMLSAKVLKTKSQQRKDTEAKTTRMLLTVSVLFILLTGPFTLYVHLVVSGVLYQADVPLPVYETIKMLTVLNSAINFVLYGVNDRSLRGKYFELWGCRKRNLSEKKVSIINEGNSFNESITATKERHSNSQSGYI